MSLSKSKKKFCRVCLKEIRNSLTLTNILEPPEPVLQLKDGVKASSYLQCYYFCLRLKGSRFNIESLSEYCYICTKCKGHLLKAVDFVVKSQRNEQFLMSMYEKSTHCTISNDLGEDSFSSTELNDDAVSTQSEKDISKTDIGEECLDIFEDSACVAESLEDMLDTDSEWDICEVEALSDLRVMKVDTADDIENEELKDDSAKEDELFEGFEQVIIDAYNDITETEPTKVQKHRVQKAQLKSTAQKDEPFEGFERVIIDARNDISETEPISVQKAQLKRTTRAGKESNKNIVKSKEKNLYFKCELCRKVFKLERHLYEHCDNAHDQRSLSFPCEICKNRHMSEKALLFHKRRIHKNIDYDDCQVCGKLILSAFIKKHEDQHNSDVKYDCHKCNRTFTTEAVLNQHFKAVHGSCKVQKYECPECDRYFFSVKKLKLHSSVHDENNVGKNCESTFLCDICSKIFPSNYLLKLHVRIHRGETMKCPHCKKEFVSVKDMRIHIRFHTKDFPLKCDLCPRGFAIKTHLDHHRKQHEGVRYKCQICDKEFGNTFSLTQHSYKHRGYPLSCKLCTKGYPSLFKIRLHLKNAHSSVFFGKYSDAAADQFYHRNNIPKMYPRVECLDNNSDAYNKPASGNYVK